MPTEAQWEYACRAGTTTIYSFGDWLGGGDAKFGDSLINLESNYGGSRRTGVANLLRFPTNPWKLKGMHGNVCEWCLDIYRVDLSGGQNPLASLIDEENDAHRIFRGGGWSDPAVECRSAARGHASPLVKTGTLGFRVAIVRRADLKDDKPGE